jgi:thiosulfate/3-mercaptopyruvate sulfurtransferase
MNVPQKRKLPSVLLAAVVLATACVDTARDEPAMDTLVTPEWLAEQLDDPELVVLDCTVLVEPDQSGGFRSVSGRSNYEAGHIPSAGFADLLGELSDSASSLQFAVPSPEQFAAAMGALGVGDDSRVVLYDASGSAWAARVWWMLRWIGFDNAALLDGGLDAWTASGQPLSTEIPARPARTLTPAPRPELIADRDEVMAAIADDSVVIVDVLPEPHYRGEMGFYARPGHIRSAINIPMQSFTDDSGRYLPLEQLAAMHEGDRNQRHITYCGGGIAASSSAFVMTRLGFTDVAVYTASLQEWAADSANPMDTGSQ